MPRLPPDRLLLGGALAVALASAGWFGWQAWRPGGRAAAPAIRLSGASYTPSGRDAPEVKAVTWEAPAAQHRGAEWVYEVFTPPEIYYDPHTQAFSITPPALTAETEEKPPEPPPFGLELREVRRPLFRVQLVGFVGGEGSYRGLFENALTTETFLADGGRRLPGLDVTIDRFEVRRTPVALPDSMTTNRLVATAVLRDERSGETIVLTDRERCHTGTLIAIVAADPSAEPREVREGETIELAGARYKIDKIQLAPPAIDVTKETSETPQTEVRTLTAPSPEPAPVTPPAT